MQLWIKRETSVFIAGGADNFCYVLLNPLRAQAGSAEDFVDNLLRKWDVDSKKRKVVNLESSEDDRPTEQAPAATKRSAKSSDRNDGWKIEINGRYLGKV